MWYNEYREHLLGDELLQEKRPGYVIKNTDWNTLFNLNRAQGNNSEETLAAMLDDFFGESVGGIRIGGRFDDIADLLDGKQDTIADLDIIRSGAGSGATAYQKPEAGIPASDLAAGVIPTGGHIQWTTISTGAITTGSGFIPNYSSYDYIMVKGTVSGGARQWLILPSFLFGQVTSQSDSWSFTLSDQNDAWYGYMYHSGTTGYIKYRGRSNNNGKVEAIYGGKITLDF